LAETRLDKAWTPQRSLVHSALGFIFFFYDSRWLTYLADDQPSLIVIFFYFLYFFVFCLLPTRLLRIRSKVIIANVIPAFSKCLWRNSWWSFPSAEVSSVLSKVDP
jgi:hypothetical protein